MKLTVPRQYVPHLTFAACGAFTLLAAGVALFSASRPPEVMVSPAIDCDNSWLTNETADISYSAAQVRLYLNNTDPSLCDGQSMIGAQLALQAQQYLASMFSFTTDPKHPCSKGPVEQCFDRSRMNITKELRASQKPAEKIELMYRLLALTMAFESYKTGRPISVIKGPDVNMAVVLGENLFSRDAKAAAQAGLEGQAAQIRQERQAEKQSEKDLDKDTIELK